MITPTVPGERIELLDVMRGAAVFGILLVNINQMGMPMPDAVNPDAGGADRILWFVTLVFIKHKMRTLFTLLFGAGACVFLGRAGEGMGRRYFWRCSGLAVLGLAHGLLWHGDILLPYAIAGALFYFVRNWTPRRLMIGAAAALSPLLLLPVFVGVEMVLVEELGRREQQGVITNEEREQLKVLRAALEREKPRPPDPAREVAERRGRLTAIEFNKRERSASGVLLIAISDVLAAMMIGAALWKNGILAGTRSNGFYYRLAAVGAAVGLPLFVWMAATWSGPNTDEMGLATDGGRIALALAYAAGVILVVRSGRFPGARRMLAVAGRMALTNYVAASVVALLIFSGFGLMLFGRLSRTQLLVPVALIWMVQMVMSRVWLARHRFGPLEWWLREMTYGRVGGGW